MSDQRLSGATRRLLLGGSLGIAAASGLPGLARAAARDAAASAIVDGMVRDHGFQGVVVLGRAGQVRFARAEGAANIETGTPMRTDTPLGIASISKRLTAVAVMRLVETGRLSLDAPIVAYLPDYRPDTGARVTLRRLLSNSSGVPNLFLPAVRAEPALMDAPLTTAEAIRRFCMGDLAFEPGERFDYALTNWIIVQGVLEAVTGMPYGEAMRALVLDPLALANTTLTPPPHIRSYRPVSPPVEWVRSLQPYLSASGGYYSTAPDLLRFAHQVYDGSFLSASSRGALTTVEVASDGYSLGGRIRQVRIGGAEVAAAWETGNSAGYRSVLGHRLDGKATVAILNNTALSQRTLDEFADALLRADQPA